MCSPLIMPRFVTIRNDVENILKKTDSYNRIYKDIVLPSDVFRQYTEKLSELFNCTEQTAVLSCSCIKSNPFNRETVYSLIWRLCANKNALKVNNPVILYPRFSFTGVEDIQFVSTRKKGDKYRTKIRVLTGHFAFGIIKCDFSSNGVYRILKSCGFHGRKYIPGRIEETFPGLYARALLTDSLLDPRVFTSIESNEEIESFNRKYVIGPRMGYVTCPFRDKIGLKRCLNCSIQRDVCSASYKEESYD